MPDAVSFSNLNKFVIPESAGTNKSACNELFLLLFPEGSVPF